MAKTTDAHKTVKPAADAYTGMLIIALVALLAGGGLVFLDYNRHAEKPKAVDRSLPTYPGAEGETKKEQQGEPK